MNRKNIVKFLAVWMGVMIAMSGLMPFNSPYVSAQAAVKQAMMLNTSGFSPGFPGDPGSCDIECQLIEVQRKRVEMLQNQVSEKLDDIRLKQTEQSKLVSLLTKFNELHRSFAADSTPKTPIPSTVAGSKEDIIRGSAELNESNHDLRRSLVKIRMKQDIEQAVDSVQTRIDFYKTELEQDWMEFQSLNEKLQEAIKILNDLLKKQGNL
ncbi:Uncharacterised protein [Chlamydia abortus]|uniref:hypothetical protein n=1 Tax=Paenibacillus sp. SAFN-117 TaxID=3436860 RepID=UPI000A27F11A|nr:Uncharacterised protein [Chlamydia abortus]